MFDKKQKDFILANVKKLYPEHVDSAKKLLELTPEAFDLIGDVLVHCDIKFVRSPVIKPALFNLNLLKELNVPQLRFLDQMLQEEFKARGLK